MFFAVCGDGNKTTDNSPKEMISGITELNNNNINKTEVNRCPYKWCNTVFRTQAKLDVHLHLHNSEDHLGSPPALTNTSSSPVLPTIDEEEIEITSMEPPSKKHRLFQVHSSGVLVNPNIEIVDSLDDCQDSPEKQSLLGQEHAETKDHGFLSKVRQLAMVDDLATKTSNAASVEPAGVNKPNINIFNGEMNRDTEITADHQDKEARFACLECLHTSPEFKKLKCHYKGRHPSAELPQSPEKQRHLRNYSQGPMVPEYVSRELDTRDQENISVTIKPRLPPSVIRTRSQSSEKFRHVEVDGKF